MGVRSSLLAHCFAGVQSFNAPLSGATTVHPSTATAMIARVLLPATVALVDPVRQLVDAGVVNKSKFAHDEIVLVVHSPFPPLIAAWPGIAHIVEVHDRVLPVDAKTLHHKLLTQSVTPGFDTRVYIVDKTTGEDLVARASSAPSWGLSSTVSFFGDSALDLVPPPGSPYRARTMNGASAGGGLRYRGLFKAERSMSMEDWPVTNVTAEELLRPTARHATAAGGGAAPRPYCEGCATQQPNQEAHSCVRQADEDEDGL
jgi:hypothetical protein